MQLPLRILEGSTDKLENISACCNYIRGWCTAGTSSYEKYNFQDVVKCFCSYQHENVPHTSLMNMNQIMELFDSSLNKHCRYTNLLLFTSHAFLTETKPVDNRSWPII